MRAYSIDLRERVLMDWDAGVGTNALARKYHVSPEWVRKLRRQRDTTGDIAPRRGKTGPKPKLAAHVERITELVRQSPDATLGELRQILGLEVSLVTLWRVLKKLGLVLKKSPACSGAGSTGCGRAPDAMAVLASAPSSPATGLY
jgi:transposase